MKSFDVALRASNETIYLSVRDAGVGFDTVEGLKGYGMGLISIRERTRFVNGTERAPPATFAPDR